MPLLSGGSVSVYWFRVLFAKIDLFSIVLQTDFQSILDIYMHALIEWKEMHSVDYAFFYRSGGTCRLVRTRNI